MSSACRKEDTRWRKQHAVIGKQLPEVPTPTSAVSVFSATRSAQQAVTANDGNHYIEQDSTDSVLRDASRHFVVAYCRCIGQENIERNDTEAERRSCAMSGELAPCSY